MCVRTSKREFSSNAAARTARVSPHAFGEFAIILSWEEPARWIESIGRWEDVRLAIDDVGLSCNNRLCTSQLHVAKERQDKKYVNAPLQVDSDPRLRSLPLELFAFDTS